jgi:hypothetical protein
MKQTSRPASHSFRNLDRSRWQLALICASTLAIVGSLFIWRSFAAVPAAASDLNGDGVVNLSDLSILLSSFGTSSSRGDLDGNGVVNLTDLSILLSNYGKTIPVQPPTPTPPTPPPTPTPPPGGGGTTKQVEITYYGAWDNDPPGSRDIAHPVIHNQAGGTGTYADPLTFASPAGSGAYAFGTIIYVPSVQKYFIREDECAVSWTAPDGCGAVSHVDLYVGNPSDSKSVIPCEEQLTPSGNAAIIVSPAANLTVDPKPLWDQSTGTCGNLH